jgi:hypothetical protein
MPDARDRMTRGFVGRPVGEGLDFIGLTERFDDDLERLASMLRWPAVTAPRVNVNTSSSYRERELDSRLRAEIEALNPADMALFRRVLKFGLPY